MRSLFSGYYTPTEEDFSKIWSEGTFVFDTNTLLNLYRYDTKTRDLLLNVMGHIKDRIWIPHQIALEYHKHMLEEIHNQNNTYKSITDKVSNSVSKLKNELKGLRHSNIDVDKISIMLEEVQKNIDKELKEQKQSHPDLNGIMEQITKLLDNKIGDEYLHDRLEQIYEDGERRYKQNIPPGFKDAKEKEDQTTIYNGLIYKDKFGDLIFWNQILDFSKEKSTKSVILVTDDAKEDWVYEVKGKKQGPHPELVHEFKRESDGKAFYLYNTEQFLKYAVQFLKLSNETLDSGDIDRAIENVKSTKEILQELQTPTGAEAEYVKIDMKKMNKIKLKSRYLAFLQSTTSMSMNRMLDEFQDDFKSFFDREITINEVDFGEEDTLEIEFSTSEPISKEQLEIFYDYLSFVGNYKARIKGLFKK